MTQSNTPPAARKQHSLLPLRHRDNATASLPIADGPAWRSRAVAPTRLSPILSVFFAALAATPLATHAGDLLRGGAGAGVRGSVPGSNPSSAQATAQARANAQDILVRTTQAVQAVQAMQKVARSSAASGADNAGRNPANGLQLPNVPNGLAPGGLVVAPGGVWTGARKPQQTTSGSQTLVDIQQTAPQAVLTWQSFNIGRKTTLNFDQSFGGSQTSQWIAFNLVNDPSGVPSQILGSIQANGQVFVINRNGIIFGGASQVNTHALFASSLPINTSLITSGLLVNPSAQFLFSSGNFDSTTSFTPPATPSGDVTVESGANITAPTSAAHVGGRVVLVGPNVTNNGSISTPDGQTILAAGQQVGLQAHPSADPTLRGLDAYVGAVNARSGTAINNGLIEAPRGDTTITGKTVQQNGVIDSSTSVTLNGRVDLLADYGAVGIQSETNAALLHFAPSSSGTVTFGQGSVTQILPEWSSAETNVGTQLPLPSQVIVQGQSIHMASNAILLAPGAMSPSTAAVDLLDNSLSSGVTFNAGSWLPQGSTTNPLFLNTKGQIVLDPGSAINVAGSTDVIVPVTQNILSVTLRGTELANAPTQRNGPFRGLALSLDIRNTGSYNGQYWVGTPLANVYGFVGLIQKAVGQLTVDGGTVSLSAGGSVVMQNGSTVDVSGGYLHYTGATVQTTRVLAGGRVVDISQATPDQTYQGIYTGQFTVADTKWGVTNQFTNPLALTAAHFEPAYDQGGNGGTLTITAPTMALDGTLRGNTVMGSHQLRTKSTTYASTLSDAFSTSTASAPPSPSTLNLSFQAVDQSVLPTVLNDFPATTAGLTPPNIIFQKGTPQPAANPTNVEPQYNMLLGQRGSTVILSPDLMTQNGFGNLNVNNRDGTITVPDGVALKAPAGGSISLTGVNIDIEGQVSAPGGSLTFNVNDFTALEVFRAKFAGKTPRSEAGHGSFLLGSHASLSTAGLIVDDRQLAPDPFTQPLTINGGAITINTFRADLSPGSLIDVSGGVAISSTGQRTYGNGGAITIATGKDISLGAVLGGTLDLGSDLRGFSSGGGSASVGALSGGGNGGSLSIQTNLIQIGNGEAPAGALVLSPEFFNQGGFASFTLTGLGEIGPQGDYLTAINITPGTMIEPVVQARVAVTTASGVSWQTVNEPLGIRTPVSLTFKASLIADPNTTSPTVALTRGDFVMGAGAVIRTDPLGSVTINTQTAAILGSIVAPGGSISITTAPLFESPGGTTINPSGKLLAPLSTIVPSLDLGPHSFLSTAGTVVTLPNPRGYQLGSVLAGGSITLSGNLVAEAGSVLDVSGTQGILDLSPAASGMSAPLLGALSGTAAIPQTGISAPTFRGLLIQSLLNGIPSSLSGLPTGSFSGTPVAPTLVETSGGSITLTGTSELFVDATLRGAAGGPTAVGGTLSVNGTLTVKQGGPTIPVSSFYHPGLTASLGLAPAQATNGQTAIGQPLLKTNGAFFAGSFFSANTFAAGGFDNLVLGGGNINFNGPVSITARGSIVIGNSGIISANSTVDLTAPYIELGQPFIQPGVTNTFATVGTYGPGRLNVTAQFIDIGNLALLNIGQATFNAIDGDIRGNGILNVAGNIVLRAGQIYPTTEGSFTIAAADYTVGGIKRPGTVTILPGGVRQLPLSADGTLNITGSIINQGGTLRAPLGTINLGTSTTTEVNLLPGSITSVSAIDPLTGQGMIIPFGIDVNGTSWIDPVGTDITAGLVPQKSITITGLNVNAQAGSLIDMHGGGDLLAYQWVSGAGGTNDILSWNFEGAWSSTASYQATQIVSYKGSYYYATANNPAGPPAIGPSWNKVTPSFAVIPGYQANYAPFAPYNNLSLFNPSAPAPSSVSDTLGADQGYVNNLLTVGSQIYLGATPGLKAGVYTLLPARYAVLPGAFLVTPQSGASPGSFTLSDGSNISAGYRFNSLDQTTADPQLYTPVSIASADVYGQRAAYTTYSANDYLRSEADVLGISVPRLPVDAGSLVISGINTLAVSGNVTGQGAAGGRGAWIDLSTTENILIGAPSDSAPAGTAFLNATLLNTYGAESLLIGGTRQTTATGTTITVTTSNIELGNAGAPLIGPEIILVAKKNITVDPGGELLQEGSIPQGGLYPRLPLVIGNATTSGSGDGVLLRVSDVNTPVVRPVGSVSSSTVPNITIGAGATIAGQNVTIDSTAGGTLDPTAKIIGRQIDISASRISIVLNNPGALQANPGIVLQGTTLNSLLGSGSLSLSGYSSIDLYGTGTITSGNLGLHAPDLRGFTNDPAGVFTIDATSLTLDNAPGQTSAGPAAGAPVQGSLVVNAGKLFLGVNTINIDQYTNVTLNASQGVLLKNTGGLSSQTNLTITTPVLVGAAQANQTITAKGGALMILAPTGSGGSDISNSAGLGATLNLIGQGVTENSRIYLPSGQLNLQDVATTAAAGGISVGGTLDVSGTALRFYDTIAYTPGGNVTLSSANGSIMLGAGSSVSVAANAGGADAGSLSVSAPKGTFSLLGTLFGQGGAGGKNGNFLADFSPDFNGGTPTFSMSSIDAILNAANFSQSRTYRIRTGNVNVDGTANALNYTIAADGGPLVTGPGPVPVGNIEVTGTGNINAAGFTGGNITLIARGNVTLDSGAVLTVEGQHFNDAGKGGSVTLEAGSEINGTPNLSGGVNIQLGSTINLNVDDISSNIATSTIGREVTSLMTTNLSQLEAILTSSSGATLTKAQIDALTPAQVAGLVFGDFTGTLHIRLPQLSNSSNFASMPVLNGDIINPSSIVVEGYKIYTPAGGTITTTVENQIKTDGTTFATGTAALYGASGLLASNPDVLAHNANGTQLLAALSITPGAEIINTSGNLTLGTTSLTTSSDWDLSSYRFGPKNAPGVLTFRASGNLVFLSSLSDGFSGAAATAAGKTLYTAPLMAFNPLLPADAQSYSYNLAAGADFSGVNVQAVLPLTTLQTTGTGSLLLGKTVGANGTASNTFGGGVLGVTGGSTAATSSVANVYGQMIRTGSGSINIFAGNNVQLMNNIVSIYTSGTQVANATVLPDGTLQLPILYTNSNSTTNTLASANQSAFGAAQEPFRSSTYQGNPQYSLGGGDITIQAQGTIAHYNVIGGVLVDDSSKELPDNWLGRRDIINGGQFVNSPNGDLGSTTWWVDFSNFFEGVGALGGGNITLVAGNDIKNIDAAIPTNARVAGFSGGTQLAPGSGDLLQLGGGDLVVKAGHDINAGVYYVEAGTGALTAGNQVTTNATRDISQQNVGKSNPGVFVPSTSIQSWLPTTLFLGGEARNGASGFTVFANQDVRLGPVSDAFMLPESVDNTAAYRTYFSTYASSDYVNVSSLGGNVTLAEGVTNTTAATPQPFLESWIQNVLLGLFNNTTVSKPANIATYQPWLRVNEILPGSLKSNNFDTAFGILPPTLNVTAFSGDIDTQGNLNLMPSPTGTLNFLAAGAINGLTQNGNKYGASTINLSDANPASIFGVNNPLSLLVPTSLSQPSAITFVRSSPNFANFNIIFSESGQTTGPGLVSGLDYGSPITQQALHDSSILHANDPNPLRLYTLGGDISGLTLYSSKPADILASQDITDVGLYIQNVSDQSVSVVSAGRDITPYEPSALLPVGSNVAPFGDIQISGPGTLEVLAGRNLDLGAPLLVSGSQSSALITDGLGLGVVSIGNLRNPALPFTGANIITAAGLGGPADLSNNSNLSFTTFEDQYLKASNNGTNYLAELGVKTSDLSSLSAEQRAALATDVLFLILRDAGRAQTAGTGSYSSGFAAISKLFGSSGGSGNVSLTSREIATSNGGDIQVLAPGGNVVVGFDVIGQALSQGIITQAGGNIDIFSKGDVTLGTSRVFTLRGGNIIIWSSDGSIAAGTASKTVTAAPPTQVLVDAASADVKTNLAGLATGGGIGVLAAVADVPPGNVDLIAPSGVVDAGDAGIRASGNLNIAATKVLNADNIQVTGTSAGTPTAVAPSAPNIGGLTAGNQSTAATAGAASDVAKQNQPDSTVNQEEDSIISVEVLGYGGGDGSASGDATNSSQ